MPDQPVGQSKGSLEVAVTSALPEGRKAYFFAPVLLWHTNGSCYGVFGSANQALAWQRGADAEDRRYFYLTDAQGRRVTLEADRPGHAAAIIDALDRRGEATNREAQAPLPASVSATPEGSQRGQSAA